MGIVLVALITLTLVNAEAVLADEINASLHDVVTKSWTLYHSWQTKKGNDSKPQYHYRGKIKCTIDLDVVAATAAAAAEATVTTTKTATTTSTTDSKSTAVQWTIENDSVLTADDVDHMIAEGWYTVIAVPDIENTSKGAGMNSMDSKDDVDESNIPWDTAVMTTVPACQVRRANFRYVIIALVLVFCCYSH
jgi:hypothetical protein